MASRKSRNIYIPKYFMAVGNLHKYFSSLLMRGTYIGELRNDRKFKCENKPFIVFLLIFRRVLF